MTTVKTINGTDYIRMLRAGAANLRRHEDEVNDLNVFPIPDGDTGSNMLLTLLGGITDPEAAAENIGSAAKTAADGMLLSARGNSGVILSQFFSGIADGLSSFTAADRAGLADAFDSGVKKAYGAVLTPVEGTVLTVARESAAFAGHNNVAANDPEQYLSDVVAEAKRSLSRTPELLDVLKEAGVVDSGGAGFIYIIEGMRGALAGDVPGEAAELIKPRAAAGPEPDYELFTADSELEFGYCTEVLVRLQHAKCDVDNFDVSVVREFLQTVGDSIVAFRNGSALKIHVHTLTPDRVLAFCRKYGEFLSVKIENMSLQHSNLDPDSVAGAQEPRKRIVTKRKPFGIVCVASGDGMMRALRDLGADQVISGGQSMNPSAKEFVDAFEAINAERLIVFPNNSNIILTARQAAEMYTEVPVTVIASTSVAECHAALSMMNPQLGIDEMIAGMEEAMEGIVTAAVSRCSRDTHKDNFDLRAGQFIGFTGKQIVSADNDRLDTARMLLDILEFGDREVCILFAGKDAPADETAELEAHIRRTRPGVEVFTVDGGQDVYDYIIAVE